jgi:hypothetical protein
LKAKSPINYDLHFSLFLEGFVQQMKSALNKIKFSGKDVITAVRASAEAVLKKDEKDERNKDGKNGNNKSEGNKEGKMEISQQERKIQN